MVRLAKKNARKSLHTQNNLPEVMHGKKAPLKKSTQKPTQHKAPITAKPLAFLKRLSVMQIALTVSALVHLVILSIHFEPELRKFRDRLPVLEVVLVNAKTKTKPKDADLFAQTNLDRGGNTDQNRKMKSALPTTKESNTDHAMSAALTSKAGQSTANTADDAEQDQQHLSELEKKARELMIQIQSSHKISTTPVVKSGTALTEQGRQSSTKSPQESQELNQTVLEMKRLEAMIAKQQDEYQKRPKRKFIGARASEYRYAQYVDSWRQKVEKIGNNNYPQIAKQRKLYGKLQLTVSIKKDGSIENIELDRSSGHRILDEAAKHIVELGAPYAKFSDDIRKETDILSITRTWTFTRDDNITTEQ